jgi:hypothetical protein
MRRRRIIGVAALALAGTAAFALWPRPVEASRICRENFDRIEEGMTAADVVAILGPPGDYKTWPTSLRHEKHAQFGPIFSQLSEEVWENDEVRITVTLSSPHSGFARWKTGPQSILAGRPDDEVFAKTFQSATRLKQPALDDLLWQIKRLRGRCFP